MQAPPTLPHIQTHKTLGFRATNPALCWAALGAFWMAFQFYVLAAWALGTDFKPTDPGPDPLPENLRLLYTVLQIVIPLGAAFMFWKMLFGPWIRNRRITTDGRILFAAAMFFFWDMSLNYSSIALFYNSHFVNFGAWANGAWPTWFSPTGHLLPEPFLFIMPAYVFLIFSQALGVCWALRKIKARYPNMGIVATVLTMIVSLTISDSIIEILFLRTGMYAYPGSIAALTLFAGETYQFPLTEGFLFGGLGITSIAVVHYFRDDKGQTFVERGVNTLRYPPFAKSWIHTLTIYGFIHTLLFLLYFIPCQWVTLNADPFPEGYPSYMTNGMCKYGINADQCPGPGVMMPRPPFPEIPK